MAESRTFDINFQVSGLAQTNAALARIEQQGKKASDAMAIGFAKAQVALAAVSRAYDGTVRALSGVVRAANEQAAALNRLDSATRAHGGNVESTRTAITAFADQLQRTTKIGDDTTIMIAANIEAMTGLREEGLVKATQAAIQFSKAYGVDLNAASLLVSKALIGNTASLSRYGLQLKGVTDQQEILNAILDKTAAGMRIAMDEVNTLEGAWAMLDNSLGEVSETIGGLLTQNPFLIEAVKGTAMAIFDANDAANDFNNSGDQMQGVMRGIALVAVDAASAVLDFVVGVSAAVELASNPGKGLKAIGQRAGANYLGYSAQIADMFGADPIAGKLGGAAVDLYHRSNQTMREAAPFTSGLTDIQGDMDALRSKIETMSYTAVPGAGGGGSGSSRGVGGSGKKGKAGKMRGVIDASGYSMFTPDMVELLDMFAEEGAAFRDRYRKGGQGGTSRARQLQLESDQLGAMRAFGGARSRRPFDYASFLGDSPSPMRLDGNIPLGLIDGSGGPSRSDMLRKAFGPQTIAGLAGTLGSQGIGATIGQAGSIAGGAIGGPLGAFAGGILGRTLGGLGKKLFGGGQKPRGDSPAAPVFTKDVGQSDLLTELVNITKGQLAGGGLGRVARLESFITEGAR